MAGALLTEEQIRQAHQLYLTSLTKKSIRAIGEELGFSKAQIGALQQVATKKSWKAQRQKTEQKTTEKTVEKISDQVAEAEAETAAAVILAHKAATREARRLLAHISQLDDTGKPKATTKLTNMFGQEYDAPWLRGAKDVKALVDSLHKLVVIERLVFGIDDGRGQQGSLADAHAKLIERAETYDQKTWED